MPTDDYSDIAAVFNTNTSWCLDDHGRFREEVYEWARPTVSVALMHGNQVLLVQSSKRCADESASWILPQGGVNKGEDIYSALVREMWQELGLAFSDTALRALEDRKMFATIGTYTNPPREEGCKPKQIIAVAMQVYDLGAITLNDENTAFVFVGNQHALWHTMARTRDRKFVGTCLTISHAHRRGLIGWSCDDVIGQLIPEVAA